MTKAPRIALGLRLLALMLALVWLPSGRVDFASHAAPRLSVMQRAPEAAITAHRPPVAPAEAKALRGSPNKTALPGQPAVLPAKGEHRAVAFTHSSGSDPDAGPTPRPATHAQARGPPARFA